MTSSNSGQVETVNGFDMYYDIHGQGEPLVLLHGFGGAATNWEPFIPDFANEYKVITPDLRGHGRSTNPSMQFTFRQSGSDVLALLDRIGVDKFKAIGLSGGAKILLHAATQQPQRVEALVLVSAAPYFPPQARAIMSQYTVETRSEEEWSLMRQWQKHGDDQIRALWRHANNFKDSYDDMNFTPPLLSTITARTLIVHGDRDPFYPVGLAAEMYESIPRSYLWIIPNGGHGPVSGALKTPFTETALAFLRGEWD